MLVQPCCWSACLVQAGPNLLRSASWWLAALAGLASLLHSIAVFFRQRPATTPRGVSEAFAVARVVQTPSNGTDHQGQDVGGPETRSNRGQRPRIRRSLSRGRPGEARAPRDDDQPVGACVRAFLLDTKHAHDRWQRRGAGRHYADGSCGRSGGANGRCSRRRASAAPALLAKPSRLGAHTKLCMMAESLFPHNLTPLPPAIASAGSVPPSFAAVCM